MPELTQRPDGFYLLYPHGEEVGPFADNADVEKWLEWLEKRSN
jgi:hypothetical protein